MEVREQRPAAAPPASAAYAHVVRLHAELLAHPSASEVLRRWSRARGLGDRIAAIRLGDGARAVDASVRSLLQADDDEAIRHRPVALSCGGRTLCLADNWYRPDRLTEAMNAELDATDTPFGLVAAPLRYRRLRLEARVLVAPEAAAIPREVIRQRALLTTPDGAPFSYVIETFTHAVLDEGPSPAPP